MKLFVLFYIMGMSVLGVRGQQDELPFREIPDYPNAYTAGNVAARVVDGLGFRYYWATEGLRPEDLAFKPSGDARTTEETLIHIYQLSLVIVNTSLQSPNMGGVPQPQFAFEELRKKTLENIKTASDRLKASQDLEDLKVVFKSEAKATEFPFWNLLNGPIDDALWHVGQVISFRRSSGNPYNSNASVFTGKVKSQQASQEKE